MKSITSIKKDKIVEKWYVINAKNKRLGRISSVAAELLMGKRDPLVRSYLDPRVKVIIINANAIDITEKKLESEFLKRYSGYPGGLKFTSLKDTFESHPERPLEESIKGMLPRNKRGSMLLTNLRVYKGETHPHTAQNIVEIDVDTIKI